MKRMWSRKEVKEQVQSALSSGDMKNVKILENIVDKDGHERFIEGNIETPTLTGVSFTFAKWSLSGSHLMLVLGGSIENATAIPSTNIVINIPKWVLDKIVALVGSVVDNYNTTIRDNAYQSAGTLMTVLSKSSGGDFKLNISASTTSNAGSFRVIYDLLIDNE